MPAGAPNTLSEISGHPGSKWGGSVMVALQIKNIPWGAGDDIKMDASYAKGDTKNVISTSAASPSFAMFGGSSSWCPIRASASVRRRMASGHHAGLGCSGGDGSIHLTTAYGFRGAYNHNWDPYWSTQPVRQLFGRSVRRHVAKAQCLHRLYRGCESPSERRLQLQPELQRRRSLASSPAGLLSRT